MSFGLTYYFELFFQCRKEPIVPNEMTAVEVRLWDEGKENTLNETIKKLISPGKRKLIRTVGVSTSVSNNNSHQYIF